MSSLAPPTPARPLLIALVAVQLSIIGGGFWMLSAAGYGWVTPLEVRPLGRSVHVRVPADHVVDAVHVFSGSQVLGRDPAAEEHARPVTFRSQLAFDSGHFSWIALADVAGPRDALRALAVDRLFPWSEPRRLAETGVSDGLINVFYDLGGDERAWLHNWSTVGVQEMQMSPLMPWTKRLDLIVLSTYDPDHCGGLAYVLRTTPDVLLIGPPLPKAANPRWGERGAEIVETARAARRLRTLPIGLHPLTPRLSVLVYPVAHGPAEAALVIRTGERWTVVAGAGGRPLYDLVARVENRLGRRVTGFIGATGVEGVDAASLGELASLRRAPGLRVVAGYATSPEVFAALSEILGPEAVKAARLGARIPLNDL